MTETGAAQKFGARSTALEVITGHDLRGRDAIVTGGASGIGQAIAVAFAHAGADVAFTVHRSPGDETTAAIAAAGREAREVRADLGAIDAAGAEALIAGLEDDDLNDPGRTPWLGFEARHTIAGNTYGHYEEHLGTLERLAGERS